MNNITKNALEESLKKFLLQKPLDKITINDLTGLVRLNRPALHGRHSARPLRPARELPPDRQDGSRACIAL